MSDYFELAKRQARKQWDEIRMGIGMELRKNDTEDELLRAKVEFHKATEQRDSIKAKYKIDIELLEGRVTELAREILAKEEELEENSIHTEGFQKSEAV